MLVFIFLVSKSHTALDFQYFEIVEPIRRLFFCYYVFKELACLRFSVFSKYLFYSESFFIYFLAATQKVTKKSPLTWNLLKLRRKRLKTWMLPWKIISLLIPWNRQRQFFLTPFSLQFLNAISRMRFSPVDSASVLFFLFSRFSLFLQCCITFQ